MGHLLWTPALDGEFLRRRRTLLYRPLGNEWGVVMFESSFTLMNLIESMPLHPSSMTAYLN